MFPRTTNYRASVAIIALMAIAAAAYGAWRLSPGTEPVLSGAARADTAPDVALGQQPMVGWISGNTLIEGIKAAGLDCPTRKAFINNLRMVKGYTADGMFPPMNFADVYNRPFFCAYYIHVVNHQFVPEFGGKQFCGKKEIVNNKILSEIPPTTTAAPTTTAPA